MPERLAAWRRLAAAAVVALLAVSIPTPAAHGQERRYWIDSFDAAIAVREDGKVVVEERLTFVFEGSFNGIYRDIPTRVRNDWNLDYRIRLQTLAVEDDAGRELRYEESWEGDDRRLKVWVPGAQDATRTVVLRYGVERALRFPDAAEGFAAHDELYWNVTGNRWSVPIRSASATVSLPAAVSDAAVMVRAFSGYQGSTDADVIIDRASGSRVSFRTRAQLEPGEGLTIVVGWPPGVVVRPTAADAARDLLRDNWPLGLPLVVFAAMLLWYRRVGRDPRIDRSVMVQYEPPADLRPAQLGTLIDEKVDLRDIVATVIDLAVRGYLRIEEKKEKGWIFDRTVTELEKLRDDTKDLQAYERDIFEGLFDSGDKIDLDDLKARFYVRLGGIRSELYGGLTDAGLFRARPDQVRVRWFVVAGITLIACIVAGAFLQKLAFFFAAPLCALAIALFAPFMPARTHSGRLAWIHAKGFEEFISRTDAERLRQLGLGQVAFEQFLPYAMALGVADRWAASFKDLLERAPQWYRGPMPGQFDALGFSSRMSSMNTAMAAAMTTMPRSSSGSSGFSSGGGFSGGGFGGGGGGAF